MDYIKAMDPTWRHCFSSQIADVVVVVVVDWNRLHGLDEENSVVVVVVAVDCEALAIDVVHRDGS